MILQIGGRSGGYTYGCLDGHTDIWSGPFQIVLKFFDNIFLATAIFGYPVIFWYPTKIVSGLTLVHTIEQRTAGYYINFFSYFVGDLSIII